MYCRFQFGLKKHDRGSFLVKVARHTRFCPFSSMASSPAFADPLLDSTSLFEDFLTSVKSMERFGRAVPRFTERTVSRIAGARSHLVEYVLKQVRCGDQKEDDEEDIWKSRDPIQ